MRGERKNQSFPIQKEGLSLLVDGDCSLLWTMAGRILFLEKKEA